MRIVFAGSPEFSVASLEKLLDGGKQIVAVITQPDKPVGRKKIITPTPVKKFALERGLKVYDFEKIRDNVDVLRELDADIMITCAYGQILSKEVLEVFKGGVWNIHASLLPKYRGASPIQSAILAGEEYSGITVMKTELELDSGGMLLVKRIKMPYWPCGKVTAELAQLGAEAALEAVELLEKGDCQLLMQNEAEASYCKKITKKDARIDFNECGDTVANKIRAFSPEPAAYCFFNGVQMNVLDAVPSSNYVDDNDCKPGQVIDANKANILVRCGGEGDDAVRFTVVQLAGGKVIPAGDLYNGRKVKAGDFFE